MIFTLVDVIQIFRLLKMSSGGKYEPTFMNFLPGQKVHLTFPKECKFTSQVPREILDSSNSLKDSIGSKLLPNQFEKKKIGGGWTTGEMSCGDNLMVLQKTSMPKTLRWKVQYPAVPSARAGQCSGLSLFLSH